MDVLETIVVLLILRLIFNRKLFPDFMRGMSQVMSEISKAWDQTGIDAGKNIGGIYGEPSADALTPGNDTVEQWDPAELRDYSLNPSRGPERRSIRPIIRVVGWVFVGLAIVAILASIIAIAAGK